MTKNLLLLQHFGGGLLIEACNKKKKKNSNVKHEGSDNVMSGCFAAGGSGGLPKLLIYNEEGKLRYKDHKKGKFIAGLQMASLKLAIISSVCSIALAVSLKPEYF